MPEVCPGERMLKVSMLWARYTAKSFFFFFFNEKLSRIMRKGPGRHDTWFRIICIWNHLLKLAAVVGLSFNGRFLRFQLFFFRTFITSIMLLGEWSGQKNLKLKRDKICRSGPFRMTRPRYEWPDKQNLVYFNGFVQFSSGTNFVGVRSEALSASAKIFQCAPHRVGISFFNNFSFFKHQETVNILCLDFSEI